MKNVNIFVMRNYIFNMSNKKELPELAKNIRLLRQQAGFSQAEFGKKIGYSQQIINAYENGQRIPPTATLELLTTIFNVSIDMLVGKKKMHGSEAITPTAKIMKKLKAVETLPAKEQKKVFEYIELLTKASGIH
jgi:transcriptional regulator with XRE-family HTH domain